MKDGIKTGLFLTGVIIGAGFASGRELITFFGKYGWWAVPLCALSGALFILGFILFMRIGAKVRPEKVEDINTALFGKFSIAADILVLLNFILSGAVMLGGSGALAKEAFGLDFKIPWPALIACVIVFFCILTGIKGLVKINAVVMPFCMGFLLLVSVITIVSNRGGEAVNLGNIGLGLWAAASYVSMNLMQSFGVIGSAAKHIDDKAVKRGSIIGGSLLSAVMAVVIIAVLLAGGGAVNAEMPTIYLSKQAGPVLAGICAVAVWLALMTSLLSSSFTLSEWLNSFLKCRWLSAICVLAVCLTVSMLGFSTIIKIFFPIQGAIGILYVAGAVRYYFKEKLHVKQKPASEEKAGFL